jgi:hypothetical protein
VGQHSELQIIRINLPVSKKTLALETPVCPLSFFWFLMVLLIKKGKMNSFHGTINWDAQK